jgi:hypothetical protein
MPPMGGYPPYAGFTEFALAAAVFLSALVSLIGTSARKRTIALGEAKLADLAEMTGILDPRQVIAVFGPPDMGRVWRTVTLFEVRRQRRPTGWLISSDLVDYACMAAAALAILLDHRLLQLALLLALAIQVAGWIAATRVPR